MSSADNSELLQTDPTGLLQPAKVDVRIPRLFS